MMQPYAMLDELSQGRRHPEDLADTHRGIYERDIDRVIHSRAFKRLAGKTQVISGRLSDHHRTRLTHSIEVATLCRSVSQQLRLNPNLAACLGFCHDLGHPPLGHSGEDVLNEICHRFHDNFEHNRHTLTIVDEFEQKYAFCPGLNLSYEVREGIVKHSVEHLLASDPSLDEFQIQQHPPLEAQLIDYCDEICYSYSDLDDAMEGGFISLEEHILPLLPRFTEQFQRMKEKYSGANSRLLFNETLRRLMNETVRDMVAQTELEIRTTRLRNVDDVRAADHRLVVYSKGMQDWIKQLKDFLVVNYYHHPRILSQRKDNMEKIQKIFDIFRSDPALLPRRYQEMIHSRVIPAHRVIVYYIAGFTDYFFLEIARQFGLD